MADSNSSRRSFLTAVGAVTAGALLPSVAVAQNRRRRNRRRNNNRNRKPPQPQNAALSAVFGGKWREANLSPPQQQQLTILTVQFAQANGVISQAITEVYTSEQRAFLERAYAQAARAGVKKENIPKRIEEARKTLTLSAEQTTKLSELKQRQVALKNQFKTTAQQILNKQQASKLFGAAKKK